MASDKTIHLRINIKKVNKDWFFVGKEGTYLDMTLFYNEEQDPYGNNGMIVQSVPAAIYKKEKDAGIAKDKMTRGEILGNAKDWATQSNEEARKEASPGYGVTGNETTKKAGGKKLPPPEDEEEESGGDDLPF